MQHAYPPYARWSISSYMNYYMTRLTGRHSVLKVIYLLNYSLVWGKGGKGPAFVTYEYTHSHLKYLQQEASYLNLRRACIPEQCLPLCSLPAGVCVLMESASASVCPHVLEKCGNFGKRWIFQNKISCVLIAGWPSRSGRSAGFAANWTTTPGRIGLSSHGNGILQNERGTAVFFVVLLSPVPIHKCEHTQCVFCFVLSFFWALWPSHFKLSIIEVVDTGTGFCLLLFHVFISIRTLHLGGGWLQMSCLISIGCFLM